jgi:hypothetical protein
LSKVNSRRSSHKSNGSGGSGSHRGSGRGNANPNNRRNSKQHRGSGGRGNIENFHRNSDNPLSPQTSYLNRRFSENSSSSPLASGVPSISAPAFIMPGAKNFNADDPAAVRRWSGNTDPVLVAKAISSNKPKTADRRSSGTTPKLAPISRPGSGNAAILASLDFNSNSRGSSTSASPTSSRNGSVQYGLPPTFNLKSASTGNISSTSKDDKFDTDGSFW